MALEDRLIEWDGKSVDFLHEVYVRFAEQDEFLDDVLAILHETSFQTSATWLLKHHLKEGNKLSGKQRQQVFRTVEVLQGWESKVHVMQCLSMIPVTSKQAGPIVTFLLNHLEDANKFVRAWAYGGLHVISEQHPSYRAESERRLAWASKNEAKSVRARIRQVTGRR